MDQVISEDFGIAFIDDTEDKTTADVLYRGSVGCVTILRSDTPDQLKYFLQESYPNVIQVDKWVMDFELDNIGLFNKQSGINYTHDRREP